MGRKHPKVSIILPTCNRKDSLEITLESLTHLRYPGEDYEVLVVDDGSTDGTGEMVEELKGQVPFLLRYLRQEKKGISTAKNLGMRNAQGLVFVSTDDDCTFPEDWLDKLVSQLDSPRVGAVGGPDRAHPADPFFSRCIDFTMTSFLGTGGIRGRKGIKAGKYYPRGFNMAISRKAIEEVGPFIEDFAPGEELELDHRLEKAGYSLKYVPDAFIWHRRRGTLLKFLKQIFSRGRSRVELTRRHRQLLEPVHTIPAMMIISFILLALLSLKFTIALKVLVGLILFYLLLLLSSGIVGMVKIKEGRALFVVPFLLMLQQIAYGAGFITALLGGKTES